MYYCHVNIDMSYDMIYISFTTMEGIYEKVQSDANGR